jgi:hypothetical protein
VKGFAIFFTKALNRGNLIDKIRPKIQGPTVTNKLPSKLMNGMLIEAFFV